MELKRKINIEIKKWYKDSTKALLIKGARQVGKTYAIRSALSELGCDFVEINLINTPEAVKVLQEAVTVDDLIMGLSIFTSKPLIKGKTILFIDEVQRYKDFVTKIKFLVDDGSFKYILSGSLLGIELTSLESAPVGYLTTYEMYPMDFEEFLQITNITDEIINHVKNAFRNRTPVSDVINEKMLALFDQYLIVGGMPEAVAKFAETHNLNDVVKIHNDIISQYKLDFTQYEATNKRFLLTNIYDLVPAELLKPNRRFIVSDIKNGLHFERVENSFLWLKNAGVVLTIYNATKPKIPLKLNEKQSLFKLYLSDIGLLTTIYGMGTKAKIISKDKSLNGGGIYENAVAQEMISKGIKPYYYNSNRLGELDFVMEYCGKIIPIEVKSGKDYTIHSALSHCTHNEQFSIDEAFVFANCNVNRDDKITYLPIYMAAFLDKEEEIEINIPDIKF